MSEYRFGPVPNSLLAIKDARIRELEEKVLDLEVQLDKVRRENRLMKHAIDEAKRQILKASTSASKLMREIQS